MEAEKPRTRRQELLARLAAGEHSFESLRRELRLSVRGLEDDLRHIERSLRRGPRRLVVTPPHCGACGYDFPGRAPRRTHTPGRCPRCRSEDILPARLRVREGGR